MLSHPPPHIPSSLVYSLSHYKILRKQKKVVLFVMSWEEPVGDDKLPSHCQGRFPESETLKSFEVAGCKVTGCEELEKNKEVFLSDTSQQFAYSVPRTTDQQWIRQSPEPGLSSRITKGKCRLAARKQWPFQLVSTLFLTLCCLLLSSF